MSRLGESSHHILLIGNRFLSDPARLAWARDGGQVRKPAGKCHVLGKVTLLRALLRIIRSRKSWMAVNDVFYLPGAVCVWKLGVPYLFSGLCWHFWGILAPPRPRQSGLVTATSRKKPYSLIAFRHSLPWTLRKLLCRMFHSGDWNGSLGWQIGVVWSMTEGLVLFLWKKIHGTFNARLICLWSTSSPGRNLGVCCQCQLNQ